MALKKREKKMLIGLGVVAAIAAVYFLTQGSGGTSAPVVVSESTQTAETEEAAETSSSPTSSRGGGGGSRGGGGSSGTAGAVAPITPQELARHSTPNNCWVVIDDDVYDVSIYIASTGDSAIAAYCGTFGFESGYLEGDQLNSAEIIIKESQKVGTFRE